MRRFQPTSRPEALSCKALKTLDERRFMPPAERKLVLQLSTSLGMDADAREALGRLVGMAAERKTCVAGRFMPDDGVSALLAGHGVVEEVEEADFFRFRKIAIPYRRHIAETAAGMGRGGAYLGGFHGPASPAGAGGARFVEDGRGSGASDRPS